MSDHPCPICGSTELRTFLELADMPAQDGVVYATVGSARAAPTGDIVIALCRDCCYIGNFAFDADKVGFAEYRYSQHHSPKYRAHVDRVVGRLVDAHGIRGKTVVDIGCGDGYFLRKICPAGDNRGIGIDPSALVDEEGGPSDGRITLIRDYYGPRHAEHRGELVSCRHVIDELPNPRAFLELISGAMAEGDGPLLYLEVPNALRTVEQKLVWNIGYAKRSWFTAASMASLYRQCGLRVVDAEDQFGGEYLGVTGRRAAATDPPPTPLGGAADRLTAALEGLGQHLRQEVERWTRRLADFDANGEKVAMWGAGMRGINFLSRLGDRAAAIRTVVDINPERQGAYLPCSGAYVEPPEALRAFSPDRVILSNPGYEQEIHGQLDGMGVRCEVDRL